MTTNQEIATIILNQLGGRRVALMTGAKNFFAIENGLQFKLPNNGRYEGKTVNCVEIKLNAADDYDLKFSYIRGMKVTEIYSTSGIQVSNLREVFERYTGLYLTL